MGIWPVSIMGKWRLNSLVMAADGRPAVHEAPASGLWPGSSLLRVIGARSELRRGLPRLPDASSVHVRLQMRRVVILVTASLVVALFGESTAAAQDLNSRAPRDVPTIVPRNIPTTCIVWFDGCNYCKRLENGRIACTAVACPGRELTFRCLSEQPK